MEESTKKMDYYVVEQVINVAASYVVLHSLCELHEDLICAPQWIHYDHSMPFSTPIPTTNIHYHPYLYFQNYS